MVHSIIGTVDEGQALDALIEALQTHVAIPWGDLEAPAPEGENKEIKPPYGIVYPIAIGNTNNATQAILPDVTKLFVVQLSVFGKTRKQAHRWARDSRRFLTDRMIGAPGWLHEIEGEDVKVIDRVHTTSPGVSKQGKWFRADSQYHLHLTTKGPKSTQ